MKSDLNDVFRSSDRLPRSANLHNNLPDRFTLTKIIDGLRRIAQRINL